MQIVTLDIHHTSKGYSVSFARPDNKKRYRLGRIDTSYDKLDRVGYVVPVYVLEEISQDVYLALFFNTEEVKHEVRVGYDLNETLNAPDTFDYIGYVSIPYNKLRKAIRFCTKED